MKKQEEKEKQDDPTYDLRLFVTGASPNSVRAIANIKDICETHLQGRYELEVMDIYQQPLVAQEQQVIALPLLLKLQPLPLRRLIGDMSDTQKVMRGLGLGN
jgi:circadian clock protein KaiB